MSVFPPRIPFVTPVLPGPGSDMWMMMGGKFRAKLKSRWSGFSRVPGVCVGEGGGGGGGGSPRVRVHTINKLVRGAGQC